MAKVSVIIPCYKQAKYLPKTLDSVLAQTYNDWECIVVNDGSPDNTEEVAKEYCDKDKRFKYVYQENQGPATARNNGIKSSSGEYILPLDSDDLISPTYIEKAVAYLAAHSDVKLVYSRTELFSETERRECDMGKYTYKDFLLAGCLIFSASMYRRADYDKTIGYNPNMIYGIEDWDFWLTLLGPDDKVHQIDEILFHYRTGENSMVSRKAIIHQEEACVQLYNNHSEAYAPYVNRFVYYRMCFNKWQHYEELNAHIYSSASYRLGHFLLSPFIWLKKILKPKR